MRRGSDVVAASLPNSRAPPPRSAHGQDRPSSTTQVEARRQKVADTITNTVQGPTPRRGPRSEASGSLPKLGKFLVDLAGLPVEFLCDGVLLRGWQQSERLA